MDWSFIVIWLILPSIRYCVTSFAVGAKILSWNIEISDDLLSLVSSHLLDRIMLLSKQSEIILRAVIQALPSLMYVSIMMIVTITLYWLLGMNFFVEYEHQTHQFVLIRLVSQNYCTIAFQHYCILALLHSIFHSSTVAF